MNKPIINGIDVSECKLYDYGICDSEQVENLNCEQNPDCYFKQFKCLQEENEKLKEVIDEAIIEHENLLINRNEFAERAEKYRQALEEIRDRLIMPDSLPENYTLKRYILEKCNEVLNDRD